MNQWYSKIDTIKSESFLPSLLAGGCQCVDNVDYFWDNSRRSDCPHVVFQYTLQGRGVLEVDNEQYDVDAGKGFLLAIPYMNAKYYYPPDSDENWRFIYCCFSGGGAWHLCRQITSKYGYVFNSAPDSDLVRQMFSLKQFAGRAISAAVGADFVFRLLTSLVESKNACQLNQAGNMLIDRCVQYIRDNLSEPINVSEAAARLNVSREHLTRLFSTYLNITPRRYIERQRIYAAMGLMRDSDMSIKEIAFQCGFASSGQFGRVFRRLMNDTPDEYRKRKKISLLLPKVH